MITLPRPSPHAPRPNKVNKNSLHAANSAVLPNLRIIIEVAAADEPEQLVYVIRGPVAVQDPAQPLHTADRSADNPRFHIAALHGHEQPFIDLRDTIAISITSDRIRLLFRR